MALISKKNNLGALSRTLRLVGPDVRPHRGLIAGVGRRYKDAAAQ